MSSCSCLTVLPGPPWVLLSKTYKPLFSPLYTHVGFLLSDAIFPRSGYIATSTVMGRSEHFMGRSCLVASSDELSIASRLAIWRSSETSSSSSSSFENLIWPGISMYSPATEYLCHCLVSLTSLSSWKSRYVLGNHDSVIHISLTH